MSYYSLEDVSRLVEYHITAALKDRLGGRNTNGCDFGKTLKRKGVGFFAYIYTSHVACERREMMARCTQKTLCRIMIAEMLRNWATVRN